MLICNNLSLMLWNQFLLRERTGHSRMSQPSNIFVVNKELIITNYHTVTSKGRIDSDRIGLVGLPLMMKQLWSKHM